MCFFNAPATTEIYTYCHTLSLHDALPSSDPYIPPYLQDRGSYSGDYVPYVPPTDRYAPAPARRAQAYPPQTYPSPASDGYVPPFIDPASRVQRQPDNLMSDIQTSLAPIRRETGPSFEGGIRFRGRDGESGLRSEEN